MVICSAVAIHITLYRNYFLLLMVHWISEGAVAQQVEV